MSRFDHRRLPAVTFGLDEEGLRTGRYTDRYFVNARMTFDAMAADRPGDPAPGNLGHAGVTRGEVADVHVEMQWFCRHSPSSLLCGVDAAIAMLRLCSRGSEPLELAAAEDGDLVPYGGDPSHVTPVLRARGRYRDFGPLETPTLGILSRATRIATNVYALLEAAQGKTVLFFPARFDMHETQALDGYAYHIAVLRYAADHGKAPPPVVSTDAQGAWWGGSGAGTVAHAAIACFHGDTAATMLAFAETMDPVVPRIALVDFHNDCVRETQSVMDAFWPLWNRADMAGDTETAKRYALYGVRPDTSAALRDASVESTGDPKVDNGVNPRLVFALREAMDNAWRRWNLPPGRVEAAKRWCLNAGIVVTGGMTPDRIRAFENAGAPVASYGVGSWCFRNDPETNTDFTADITRVYHRGAWIDMAKVGRAVGDDSLLKPVNEDI